MNRPAEQRAEQAEPRATPPQALVVAAVVVAVVAVSAAAILIRKADAPPLAIAFWRNAIAVGLLLPFFFLSYRKRQRRRQEVRFREIQGRSLALAVVSGIFLAAHFGLWIPSLSYLPVSASVVLVCTQPIFVVGLASIFLKEKTTLGGVVAIVVAIVGVALVAFGADPSSSDGLTSTNSLLGAALALAGAIAVAFYVLLGRSVRRSGVDILSYALVVYGAASVSLLCVCFLTRTPLWGYEASTWAWLVAIALGPQILGHTLINWALEFVPAPILSATILLEPPISTALAWATLNEVPSLSAAIGGGLILIALAALIRFRARPEVV